MTAIRTPSTVAHELIYCTLRDLTYAERQYLIAYNLATYKTIAATTRAQDHFGETSKTALAIIWIAQQDEAAALKLALEDFDYLTGILPVAQKLGVL